jgi:hypothetical protein
MKKFLILFSMLLAMTACNTMTSAQRAERDAQIAQAVDKALTKRHYTVDIDMMYPTSGPAKRLQFGYILKVEGDTMTSYLPYFGTAYDAPYSGGNGLDFTEPIKEYKAEQVKKDKTRITIKVDHDSDHLTYTLEIFDNGNVSLNVISTRREPINFNGSLKY